MACMACRGFRKGIGTTQYRRAGGILRSVGRPDLSGLFE
jgi:hypothetical protein